MKNRMPWITTLTGVAAVALIWSVSTIAGDPAAIASSSDSDRAADRTPPMSIEGDTTVFEAALTVRLNEQAPQEFPGMHNVYRLSEKIISGGEPLDQSALEDLAKMGVKTILSVDGKAPEVEAAAALGMRYVHVPIQYKGITDDERMQIVKTFRELDGPFYVHCFHGKHRGPAAAALGRVVIDGATRAQAIAEMRQWSGTSDKYEALYEAIAVGPIPTAEQTACYDWGFSPRHELDGVRQSMVVMTRTFDNIKAFSRRGWKIDPEHPDVYPAQEAAILAQHFEQTSALADVAAQPADFRESMAASTLAARDLHRLLEGLKSNAGPADLEAVNASYKVIYANCTSCHAKYRNE